MHERHFGSGHKGKRPTYCSGVIIDTRIDRSVFREDSHECSRNKNTKERVVREKKECLLQKMPWCQMNHIHFKDRYQYYDPSIVVSSIQGLLIKFIIPVYCPSHIRFHHQNILIRSRKPDSTLLCFSLATCCFLLGPRIIATIFSGILWSTSMQLFVSRWETGRLRILNWRRGVCKNIKS